MEEETPALYCACRSPSTDGFMIQCEKCNTWFHGNCIGVTAAQGEEIDHFYCEPCQLHDENLKVVFTTNDFSKMRVPQLQNALRARGLLTSGKKADLVKRLQDANGVTAEFFASSLLIHRGTPVFKRIPKAARAQLACLLSDLLNAIVHNPDSLIAWRRLFAFAPVCLANKGTKGRTVSLATLVKQQTRAFDSTWHMPSHDEDGPNKSARKQTTLQDKKAKAVSAKISEGDVKGAVRIASSVDTFASDTADTLELLKQKHPPPHPAANLGGLQPPTDAIPLQTDISAVAQAIRSFPAGSAGGLDGLRPQHLKDLTSEAVGQIGLRLKEALVKFCNLCFRGSIPIAVCPFFYGANLFAFSKPGGGVRPIAVGNTLRRLAGKVAGRVAMTDLAEAFGTVQLGCGTRQGAEAAAHAASTFISQTSSGSVVVKIDFKNAFNTVRRDLILEKVREKVPSLYPMIWQCYRHPSFLRYKDQGIYSCEGAQQGDPLGPLLFSLVINDLINQLKSPFNVWYLDDGTIAGPPPEVLRDLEQIVAAGEQLGLEINSSKCELVVIHPDEQSRCAVHARFQAVAPDIKLVSQDNVRLLGAAVSSGAIEPLLLSKLEELRCLAASLADLDDHVALFLLKNCFSIPKLLYVLRTAPCFESPVLTEYDSLLKETLTSILNLKITDSNWAEATQPVRYGGLGVRCASDLALPAFLASAHGSSNLVSNILQRCQSEDGAESLSSNPGDRVNTEGRSSNPIAPIERAERLWSAKAGTAQLPAERNRQKSWDRPLCDKRSADIQASLSDPQDLARYLSVCSPKSGAWLNATPMESLGLKLQDHQLRIACGLRLGAELCVPHKCSQCGDDVDPRGTHGLSCSKSAGRHVRHSQVNDLIRRACASAGVPAIIEPTGLFPDDRRPDGLTLVPWKRGRPLCWDFTCWDTVAPSHVALASSGGGKVANEAERTKSNKYRDILDSHVFAPFCVETLGAWGASASKLTAELGQRIQATSGEPRSTTFLTQAISLAVQRGNAVSVIGTLPSTESPEEVFGF